MRTKPLTASRLLLVVATVLIALVTVGCTCAVSPTTPTPGTTATPTATPPGGSPTTTPTIPPSPYPTTTKTEIDLATRNLRFNVDTIVVPADANITITLHNEDTGVSHNFAIYTDATATTAIFRGAGVAGPGTITYRFKAPSRGVYFFRSDPYPSTAQGTLVAQ